MQKSFRLTPYGDDSITRQNLLRRAGDFVRQSANKVAGTINNPILNAGLGLPTSFRDATGSVILAPGGVLDIRPTDPNAIRATLNPLSRSISLGKGPFDLSVGYGAAPVEIPTGTQPMFGAPEYWGRLGFTFGRPISDEVASEITRRDFTNYGELNKPSVEAGAQSAGRKEYESMFGPDLRGYTPPSDELAQSAARQYLNKYLQGL